MDIRISSNIRKLLHRLVEVHDYSQRLNLDLLLSLCLSLSLLHRAALPHVA